MCKEKIDLEDKKVLVTGSCSMIGRSVVQQLIKRQVSDIIIPLHMDYDLSRYDQTMDLFDREIDYVIHLAGFNGGIEFNRKYPADIYYKTSMINLNVLNAARTYNVKKIVSVLASCAYPDNIPVLREENLWEGSANASVECHGYAKRSLDIYSRCLRAEYGLNAVTVILNNSFGPNDSIDPLKTKVVMALIKKYVDAKRLNLPQVLNWGTGDPLRQFVYAEDAAEGIVQTLEKYNGTFPLNIADDNEITIRDLAEKISNLVGYEGKTVWDTNKPNGQMRKFLDVTKMKQYLNIPFTNFDEALQNTINWYTVGF